MIIFHLRRIFIPIIVIDYSKIYFPLSKEYIYWENIESIEYHTKLFINIKAKNVDMTRNKYNVPLVSYDYDDKFFHDNSLYRINIEYIKINKEDLYKLIFEFSELEKNDRND